jgi:hypothetical protein
MKNDKETVTLNKKRLSDKVKFIRKCAVGYMRLAYKFERNENEWYRNKLEEVKHANTLLQLFLNENNLTINFLKFLDMKRTDKALKQFPHINLN